MVLVSVACCAWAPRAFAQRDADKTTARNLYFEGKAAYDAKDFDKAVDRFRRSNEIFPAPTAALGLARSYREAGRLVQAYETYGRISNTPLASDAPGAFEKAVVTAKEEQTALEPRLPALVIEVTCVVVRPGLTMESKVELPILKRYLNRAGGIEDIEALAARGLRPRALPPDRQGPARA